MFEHKMKTDNGHGGQRRVQRRVTDVVTRTIKKITEAKNEDLDQSFSFF